MRRDSQRKNLAFLCVLGVFAVNYTFLQWSHPFFSTIVSQPYGYEMAGMIPLSAHTYVSTATTNHRGRYLFSLPAPGVYFVDVRDANQVLVALDRTPGSLAEPTPALPVAQDQILDGVNFGYVRATDPGQAVIGDLMWLDVDHSGTYEDHGPTMAGAEVCADPINDGPVHCTITDAQGRYCLLHYLPIIGR